MVDELPFFFFILPLKERRLNVALGGEVIGFDGGGRWLRRRYGEVGGESEESRDGIGDGRVFGTAGVEGRCDGSGDAKLESFCHCASSEMKNERGLYNTERWIFSDQVRRIYVCIQIGKDFEVLI